MQHVISPTVHTPNFGTWQSKFSGYFTSAHMIAISDFIFCCLFTNFQIFKFHTCRSSDRQAFIPNIQWDDYIYVSVKDTIWLEFFQSAPNEVIHTKNELFLPKADPGNMSLFTQKMVFLSTGLTVPRLIMISLSSDPSVQAQDAY